MNAKVESADKPHRRTPLRLVLIAVLWFITLGAAFLAGAYAYRHRATLLAWYESSQSSQIIQTSLYNLVVEKIEIPALGRDGAVDALADGVLFVNRLGESWFINSDRELNKLSMRVPINFKEFESDPYNVNTIKREQFAVKDILVQEIPSGIRLLASYSYWHSDAECYALRVSMLETTPEILIGSSESVNDDWHTVFETTPCRSLSQGRTGKRNPTLGAGGRIVSLSDTQILLSVGGFGRETDGDDDESVAPPTEKRSYGSTILIDVASGDSRNYTYGHRNPQGLATAPDGAVWLTDHGARGGDELNLILDGRNYGHPTVTYGTDYQSMIWRRNPRQGRHEGFEKPIYAWIPSIAVSQLTIVRGGLFPLWQGDAVVSSLKAQSLFRVRIEDGRTVFSEPIPIGRRIRDITEIADGTLVLKTDDNFLLFLKPVDRDSLYSLNLTPQSRGEVLATGCASCHAMTPEGFDALGPNLWGVGGRRIGSRDDFDYSDALRKLEGSWTPDKLKRFISDPQAVAPGTTMVLTTNYNDREIEDLVAFLSRLK